MGYSPKEAKIYLTLLKQGEAQISDISQKVNMPRTTVQFIIEHLYADGIIKFYIMRKHKYWVAERPERSLMSYEKKKSLWQKCCRLCGRCANSHA